MIVLAIDTATDLAGVARAGPGGVAARRIGWRSAFTELAPAAAGLLAEAGVGWPDVGALAVPAGPGSFTGLRVGAAYALGIVETLDLPLHVVPTLVAVAEAYAAPEDARACATLDARRGRRYAALLEREPGGGWREVDGPWDVEPDAVPRLAGGAPVVGPDDPRAAPGSPAPVAAALARLVAARPERWRLRAADRLEIVYARPGVEGGPERP